MDTYLTKRNEMLQILFKQIDGKMIGGDYLSASRRKDEAGMIRAVANYYRNRPESKYLINQIKNTLRTRKPHNNRVNLLGYLADISGKLSRHI